MTFAGGQAGWAQQPAYSHSVNAMDRQERRSDLLVHMMSTCWRAVAGGLAGRAQRPACSHGHQSTGGQLQVAGQERRSNLLVHMMSMYWRAVAGGLAGQAQQPACSHAATMAQCGCWTRLPAASSWCCQMRRRSSRPSTAQLMGPLPSWVTRMGTLRCWMSGLARLSRRGSTCTPRRSTLSM